MQGIQKRGWIVDSLLSICLDNVLFNFIGIKHFNSLAKYLEQLDCFKIAGVFRERIINGSSRWNLLECSTNRQCFFFFFLLFFLFTMGIHKAFFLWILQEVEFLFIYLVLSYIHIFQ